MESTAVIYDGSEPQTHQIFDLASKARIVPEIVTLQRNDSNQNSNSERLQSKSGLKFRKTDKNKVSFKKQPIFRNSSIFPTFITSCFTTVSNFFSIHKLEIDLIKYCTTGILLFSFGLILPLSTTWAEFIWIHLGFTFFGIGVGVYAISSYAQKIVEQTDARKSPRVIPMGRRVSLVGNGRRGGLSIQWSHVDAVVEGRKREQDETTSFELNEQWTLPKESI